MAALTIEPPVGKSSGRQCNGRRKMTNRLCVAFLIGWASNGVAQEVGPRTGSLVLSGGGEAHADPAVLARFVELAGGPESEIVYIPTAASGIRLPSGFIAELPENGRIEPGREILEEELRKLFGVRRVHVLHTRDRREADREDFVVLLRRTHAVWIGYGNAGRFMQTFLGTRVQHEIEQVLARGGVIGGNSAGAIVQGSFIVRGRPDKPVLMARGHTQGLALLRGVAVNPHLTSARRETELVNVVDAHPGLLGIGLEDEVGLLVRGDTAEVLGSGRAAIYDDMQHDDQWYYWLENGARFDLSQRRVLSERRRQPH